MAKLFAPPLAPTILKQALSLTCCFDFEHFTHRPDAVSRALEGTFAAASALRLVDSCQSVHHVHGFILAYTLANAAPNAALCTQGTGSFAVQWRVALYKAVITHVYYLDDTTGAHFGASSAPGTILFINHWYSVLILGQSIKFAGGHACP